MLGHGAELRKTAVVRAAAGHRRARSAACGSLAARLRVRRRTGEFDAPIR
jgi:hypothetical protein